MHHKFSPEAPTSEMFVPIVLERQPCGKHKVPVGIPCFHIHKSGHGYGAGVCNKRAKRAGFDAPVSEKSLRTNRPSKR